MTVREALAQKDLLVIMEMSSDLIHIMDHKGKMYYANKAWKQILGYHESDILSFEVFKKLFDVDGRSFITKSIEENSKTAFKAGVYKKNGKKQSADGYISPLHEITENDEALYLCVFNVFDSLKNEDAQKEVIRNLAEKEKFAGIIEATRAGTWEWSVQKEETKYNERWAEIVGYSLDELRPITHETWRKLVHPDDLIKSDKEIESLFYKEKEYYSLECRMKHKMGHWVWVLDKGKVVSWTEDGRPLQMFGTHIDITESKQLELEIKKSEDEYRFLVDSSYDIIYRLQLDGRFTFLSKAWEDLLGYTVEEAIGEPLQPYVHPEDVPRIYDFFNQINKSGEQLEARDYRLLHKNGEYHWFMTTAVPIWSGNGEIIGFTGTARDITDIKEANLALIKQKNELESFFTVNMDFFCISDNNGNFKKLNNAWIKSFHYKLSDLVGKNALEFVHPDDVQLVRETISSLNDFQKEVSFLARIKKSDDTYRILEWKAHISGELIYAAARDVTENKTLESNLFLEKELFKTTLLSVEDGVIATDKLGRINIMNLAAQMMTGWSIEEVYGKPIEEIFKVYKENTSKLIYTRIPEIIRKGKGIGFSEMILISRSDKEISIENSASPIKDHTGKTTGIVIVFRDITVKKERQKQIEFLSYHDQLTGLYNRRFIEDAIRRLEKDGNLPLSIVVMDINGLKLTNDAFGHDLGDLLLKKASKIMKNAIRRNDVLARVGGDEFVLVLPKTDSIEAERIKNRIQKEAHSATIGPIGISIAAGSATKTKISQNISKVQKVADNNMYRDKLVNGRQMKNRIIKTILESIDKKFPEEQHHLSGVANYSAKIGKAMGFSEPEVERLRLAGSLHDIGKISVPKDIMMKPDLLTFEEREVINKHAETSYQILKSVEDFISIAEDVLYHHERIDGKGYPEGLRWDEIPLNSRIIAVADAYEAMISIRPYHTIKTREEAITELRRCAGTQFDPDIVNVFIEKVL